MEDIHRYAHTLRHLTPWQVLGRLVGPLRRRWAVKQVPGGPQNLRPAWTPQTEFPSHDPWNARADLLKGRFCFLNETVTLGRPVDWQAAAMPLLWRFNLHYFHYLHLLQSHEQVALCREWIGANPVGAGVGWHPYPTALRIVNWCRAEMAAADVLESLYQQAAYLYRNLETHVGGNHLLENARALVMVGRYFRRQGEADAWQARGLELYRQELPRQILSDGMHFERSPMYHALMLEGVLDVLNVLPPDHADEAWLTRTAQRMADALAGMTHPDGYLALFNDSTHEIALPPAQLLDYARRALDERSRPSNPVISSEHKRDEESLQVGHRRVKRTRRIEAKDKAREHTQDDLKRKPAQPPRSFPEAGYYIYHDKNVWLMVDGGPGGPDHLMAHAHADLFSYELSLFGTRFVVDTGVYEYPAGPMRQYVRSTAAHNTVSVDGVDQIECWDSFRVARRAAPNDVTWEAPGKQARFEGTFDGYARWIGDGIEHRRQLDIDGVRRIIRIGDFVIGRGEHRVESYIHFHPEVEITPGDQGVDLRRNGKECRIEIVHGDWRTERGWYCPRFGARHRNCVLVVGERASLPVQLTYRIRYSQHE